MKQKFKRGSFVRVSDNLGESMSHFPNSCNAIVEYSYQQKYGSDDVKNYSLIILDDNNNPIDDISWYEEHQLTLINEDLSLGKKIIFEYCE